LLAPRGPPLQRNSGPDDVMDALPGCPRARGHDCLEGAFVFYREIEENRAFKTKNTGIAVDVQVGDKVYPARYLEGRSASGVQFDLYPVCWMNFLIATELRRKRANLEDNASRFIFFCTAALELSRRITPQLQIAHARLGRRRSCVV